MNQRDYGALPERLRDNIVFHPSGCWNWILGTPHGGYGRIMIDGKRYVAHRLIWEFFNGMIPGGMELHHVCQNRQCVNPAHLEQLTRFDHSRRDGRAATKTHCVNGHEFTPENTYVRPSRPTARSCRKCIAAGTAKWWRKHHPYKGHCC